VAALIRVAEAARRAAPSADEEPDEPVESVSEALLELLQSGDGSLGALDIPELEPLDGSSRSPRWPPPWTWTPTRRPTAPDRSHWTAPTGSPVRLDEHPYTDLDGAQVSRSFPSP